MESDGKVNDIQRLSWACRRGMLELDVLLGNFLKEAYSDLSLDNKNLFIELLEQPDPQLFTWLLGHENADNTHLSPIIERIRQHARSRL